MWFEKKKCQFPIYPSYRFCPIPKIENSEISESFLLLKFLVLYETQNLKTDWKMTPKKKTLAFSCRLRREKCQFPRFPSFRFCPIPKIENSEILERFLLLKFLVVCWNSKSKKWPNRKNFLVWQEKKVHVRGFRVFDFTLYLNSKTWTPRKVFIYFNFLSFWWLVALSMGKIKIFH